jgi:hypothetical protein
LHDAGGKIVGESEGCGDLFYQIILDHRFSGFRSTGG